MMIMAKKKSLKTSIISSVTILLLVLMISVSGVYFAIKNLKYGLDLQGGFEVLYQVESIDGTKITSDMVTRILLPSIAISGSLTPSAFIRLSIIL